jgi:predicted nuclease of predicted toxin-antitoxin system
MIRFLLDQGLPRTTVARLADHGITAVHVGELGMATATDQEIIDEAVKRDAVVVTLDSDIHSILAAADARHPSVIRIRIEGLKGDAVTDVLQQVVASAESDLESGAAVSVTDRGIRIHHLPLA